MAHYAKACGMLPPQGYRTSPTLLPAPTKAWSLLRCAPPVCNLPLPSVLTIHVCDNEDFARSVYDWFPKPRFVFFELAFPTLHYCTLQGVFSFRVTVARGLAPRRSQLDGQKPLNICVIKNSSQQRYFMLIRLVSFHRLFLRFLRLPHREATIRESVSMPDEWERGGKDGLDAETSNLCSMRPPTLVKNFWNCSLMYHITLFALF